MARQNFQQLAGLWVTLALTGCALIHQPAATPLAGEKPVPRTAQQPEKPAPGTGPQAASRKDGAERPATTSRYHSAQELAALEIRQAGISIGYIGGIPTPGSVQFEKSLRQGLQQGNIRIADSARHRVEVVARLEPERQGSRLLTLQVRLLGAGDKVILAQTLLRQMPLPIADDQWQALGESVATGLRDQILRPSR